MRFFLEMWLSVDPKSDEAQNWTPYRFCFNNPVMLVDPNGLLESIHTDENGKVIAEYDDGDDGVYMHQNGTTKKDIDKQRSMNSNTGGDGERIGELGSNIEVTAIMENMLPGNASEANEMDIKDYFFAVKSGGKWDLKNNESTIFGVAWSHDISSGETTTFSFGSYRNMNAADVGNFHAGFTGRLTYGGAGMSMPLLWYGAGAAEAYKSLINGNFNKLGDQLGQMGLGSPGFIPLAPYGDNMRDYLLNSMGMYHADKYSGR